MSIGPCVVSMSTDQPGHRVGIRNIADRRESRGLRDDRAHPLVVCEAVDRDGGAFARQSPRDRRADPLGGAGDQRDPSLL